jgi:hypothetical protein
MYKTYCDIQGAHMHTLQRAQLSELKSEQIEKLPIDGDGEGGSDDKAR